MENLLDAGTAIALGLGLLLGYLGGAYRAGKSRSRIVDRASTTDWWEMRRSLTGTQLQILQFMESMKEATIVDLQERFSFIPDRELYYRLEQIYLMGFLLRERKGGEVTYTLNSEYSATVEDDKTVMLPGDDD